MPMIGPAWVSQALALTKQIEEENLYTEQNATTEELERISRLSEQERLVELRNLYLVALSPEKTDSSIILDTYRASVLQSGDVEHQKFLSKGMDDHLAKPITKATVTNILEKWAPQTSESSQQHNVG